MADHFTKVCVFGENHGTCRCPSKDKKVIKVPCDRPNEHKPKLPVLDTSIFDDLQPSDIDTSSVKTLHDRMSNTVDEMFGGILTPIVKAALVEKLEKDVVAWLIETAKLVVEE